MEDYENSPMVSVSNREIAKMAFFKLRYDNLKDSALRLANNLLCSASISLGIGDIDWEIESALRYCGANPAVGVREVAHFNFEGTTKIPQEHYEKLKREFYD